MPKFTVAQKHLFLFLIILPLSTAINAQNTGTNANNCPCTVFQLGDGPLGQLHNDSLYSEGKPIELGMKFRSSINGHVTGVRFYKQSGNVGIHTGQLYSASGDLLASVVFTNETTSGWQQASFAQPVAITAGTNYVISYHSSKGYYTAIKQGFKQAIVNGPLRALADGEDGANGVYSYTYKPILPTKTFLSNNYLVDVVFSSELESTRFVVFPNPFWYSATISFTVAGGGDYDLRLYDEKGALVKILKQGSAVEGEPYNVEIDGAKLAKGLYLVRLKTNLGLKSAKLVLER